MGFSVRFLRVCIVAFFLMFAFPGLNFSAGDSDKKLFSDFRVARFPKPIAIPDFKLPTIVGHEVSLSQFKGKIVLVNFWTTW